MPFFRFFRKRNSPYIRPSIELASLVERRAEEFSAFYKERFGYRLNYRQGSLGILDLILSEARYSALSPEWKQWLAVHAGAYLFRVASQRFHDWPLQYLWYHPLEQPVLVVGAPVFRISMLAQQAVLQRLEEREEPPLPVFFERFEKAVLPAAEGDDLLFM
ncbi:hypothetical protein [Chitinophaga sp.]|uniref:hypothetical protein n=1 Tax=Chitinophaga sp. TaxID=1869181 RepID=UPI0031DE76EA